MAALEALMTTSGFYRFIGDHALALAFKGYAHGLYGNLDTVDVVDAADDARAWVEAEYGECIRRYINPNALAQDMAEQYMEHGGKAMQHEEPENVDGFLRFIEELGFERVAHTLYLAEGE